MGHGPGPWRWPSPRAKGRERQARGAAPPGPAARSRSAVRRRSGPMERAGGSAARRGLPRERPEGLSFPEIRWTRISMNQKCHCVVTASGPTTASSRMLLVGASLSVIGIGDGGKGHAGQRRFWPGWRGLQARRRGCRSPESWKRAKLLSRATAMSTWAAPCRARRERALQAAADHDDPHGPQHDARFERGKESPPLPDRHIAGGVVRRSRIGVTCQSAGDGPKPVPT